MVIIAKRIHLFPFRTQKLSSLAAMVLGGRPPGRVARSHVACRSGGTGRRTGLKILRNLYFRTGSIPVFGTNFNIAEWSSWQLVGLITRRSQVQVLSPQPKQIPLLIQSCRQRYRYFTAKNIDRISTYKKSVAFWEYFTHPATLFSLLL